MTTPEERRRNLIWGRETLSDLAQDDVLPPAWRSEAATLLGAYPPLSRLQQTHESDLERLQDEFVQVLSQTKWFFMRVRGHPSSTEQRRYSLHVVLRHFL
jgi:hypothetical protein